MIGSYQIQIAARPIEEPESIMTERHKCILMDPPWLERGGGKRGAQNHYSLMGLSDIAKAIIQSGIFDPAPSAHLWCWATDNYLLDALSLVDQLGFRYMRTIVWVKMPSYELMERNGVTFEPGDTLLDVCRRHVRKGLGQYARGSHELLLFATRGKAMVPAPENRPPSVIFAPRAEHSRKPDEGYELIERVSPGPRLEMFSRRAREGWTAWGDEAPTETEKYELAQVGWNDDTYRY